MLFTIRLTLDLLFNQSRPNVVKKERRLLFA
jgi:hypothetical protein